MPGWFAHEAGHLSCLVSVLVHGYAFQCLLNSAYSVPPGRKRASLPREAMHYGHGEGVMLVHSATAPSAILRPPPEPSCRADAGSAGSGGFAHVGEEGQSGGIAADAYVTDQRV